MKPNSLFRQTTHFQSINLPILVLEILKTALLSPPVLSNPNYNLPFEVHCDASGHGLGAVLVQRVNNQEGVIVYGIRLLNSVERNYLSMESTTPRIRS